MSFMTYKEVRPWAKAIAKAVESRVMPPWHASDATHGQFANERTLTDDEIAAIVAWADSGAAPGNPADAPEAASATHRDDLSQGEMPVLGLGEPRLGLAATPDGQFRKGLVQREPREVDAPLRHHGQAVLHVEGIEGVGPVVKPPLDAIMTKLDAWAKQPA